jgi:hypothetical protein
VTHRRAVTAAVVLWLVFAAVVWNVIFDRIVVLAGRRYSHDATVLFRSTGTYLLIDDVMRPAVAHAWRVASVAAVAIAVAALILIRLAATRDGMRRKPG